MIPNRFKRIQTIAAYSLSVLAAFGIGVTYGIFRCGYIAHANQYNYEKAIVEAVLRSDKSYSRLHVVELSNGEAGIAGKVEAPAVLTDLRQRLLVAHMDEKINRITLGIEVDKR